MSNNNSDLEERIAAALAKETSADALAKLINETHGAIAQAEADAAVAREAAFDPALTQNPQKARQAMEDAAFLVGRLHTLLPRLQRRYADVVAAEQHAAWLAEFTAAKATCDSLAAEFAEVYPRVIGQLVDLFGHITVADKKAEAINSAGSEFDGELRRLQPIELIARGLEDFSQSQPPIIKNISLPEWSQSCRTAWPPPQVPLGVAMAQAMGLSHPGADWAEKLNADNEARRVIAEKREKEEAENQAASRRAYEESLRKLSSAGRL